MPISEQSVRKPSRVYLRRGHPSTKGLVAAWPFFAGAGLTARDIGGRQYHGTITGATWVTGPHGPVLSFDGSGDDVSPPAPTEIAGSQDRTLIMAMHHDAGGGNQALFGTGPRNNGERWTFRLAGPGETNELRIEIEGSGYTSSLSPTDGEWNIVACVLEGSTLADHTLYLVDETSGLQSESASGTNSVNTQPSDSTTVIANSPHFTQDLSADLSFCRLYNRPLREREIRQAFERPMTPYITKPR